MRVSQASNQQASKLAPQGPLPAPEQQGSQKREKKMLPRYPGWFFAAFSETTFFSRRTPTCRKRRFSGILARFGPGHLEKCQALAETTKMQFPGARGTFGGGIRPPQQFLPEIAQLFCAFRFGRPEPQRQEIAKYWFYKASLAWDSPWR